MRTSIVCALYMSMAQRKTMLTPFSEILQETEKTSQFNFRDFKMNFSIEVVKND